MNEPKTFKRHRMYQERQGAGSPMPADRGIAEITDTLRKLLEKGGALPPERVLALQLGIKRHKLRQALEVLRAQNEIEPVARRRAANPAAEGEAMIRSTNPIEVIELRMIVEPALARLAAMRASPEQIDKLTRAATTPPGASAGQADLLFHRLVAAAGRNGLAADLYALLRRVGTDARLRVSNPAADTAARIGRRDAEHQAVAKAIAARDPDRAEAAMREHLAAVQNRVLVWLAPGTAKPP